MHLSCTRTCVPAGLPRYAVGEALQRGSKPICIIRFYALHRHSSARAYSESDVPLVVRPLESLEVIYALCTERLARRFDFSVLLHLLVPAAVIDELPARLQHTMRLATARYPALSLGVRHDPRPLECIRGASLSFTLIPRVRVLAQIDDCVTAVRRVDDRTAFELQSPEYPRSGAGDALLWRLVAVLPEARPSDGPVPVELVLFYSHAVFDGAMLSVCSCCDACQGVRAPTSATCCWTSTPRATTRLPQHHQPAPHTYPSPCIHPPSGLLRQPDCRQCCGARRRRRSRPLATTWRGLATRTPTWQPPPAAPIWTGLIFRAPMASGWWVRVGSMARRCRGC